MANNYGSEDFHIYPLSALNGVAGELFGPYDIGGTNAESDWADVADFDRIFAMITLGTYTGADKVTTFKLQQASSSTGTGAKDLTTSGTDTTSNYDSTYGPDAAGDTLIADARAEDLDITNGFHFVRVYVAATGNSNTDDVQGFLMLFNKAHKIPQVQGATAAATDTFHYVNVHSAGGL